MRFRPGDFHQTIDGQTAAFDAFRNAKLKVDANPTFANAMAAKRAWWTFLNIVDVQTANASGRAIHANDNRKIRSR